MNKILWRLNFIQTPGNHPEESIQQYWKSIYHESLQTEDNHEILTHKNLCTRSPDLQWVRFLDPGHKSICSEVAMQSVPYIRLG